MKEATPAVKVQEPPSEALYRLDGPKATGDVFRSASLHQKSRLSPHWTAKNGGGAGEAESHDCGRSPPVLSSDGAVAGNDLNTERVAGFIQYRDPETAWMAPASMGSAFLPGWGRGHYA